MKILSLFALLCTLGLGFLWPSAAQSPADLPLLTPDDLRYEGAFRLPADEFGLSSMNYSEGPLFYHPDRESIFIVGHAHQQAIAEFAVPEISNSTVITDLAMAAAPVQNFAAFLNGAPNGNPQLLDRIGGLAVITGTTRMLINAYEYYDAPGDNTHTTLSVRDAGNLGFTQLAGFFEFTGGAGHTSGWISPVPAEWQSILGGSYITGASSGIPIIGRTSVGPSAFIFDPEDVGRTSPISTTKLLDFSLDHPLHEDLENSSGANKLWTHLSRATYGVIVPGTRTYLTLGYSGGHESGVCYKCTQDNGVECGGYCAPQTDDYYHFYWLWDMNDLVAVKNGEMEAHEVRPYASGEFVTPFAGDEPQLGGASFDPATGRLYITAQKADRAQGEFTNPPVVMVYKVGIERHALFLPFISE
ncbi:hypothetical protein GC175_04725 [bacterium]|nr:hypothetical protein [bacterium]